jgi:outer membrane protein assembly factor BamB
MRSAKRLEILGFCVLLVGAGWARAQDWPQWRGPNRDNKATGFTAPQTWPKALTEKWTARVGEGVSSPVLVGDKVYVFARPSGNQEGDEVTTCLDAASGKVLWQDKYPAAAVRGPAASFPVAGTRSTPAVGEGKVCTLGVAGVVSCLDADTGKVVWRKDTKSKPDFYTSSSPLIADGMCVVFVGALTAYDLATGDVKWPWKGGKAPYGSPVLMTVDGTKMVVTPTSNSLVGVALADGKLLWEKKLPGFGYTINYDTPIIDGQTVIYASPAKRGVGTTMALKIDKMGDKFTPTEVWKVKFAPNQYNTPVLKDGLLFGLSPEKTFFCMDAKTGKILWTDSTKRGEVGGIINAGSVLLALTGRSELIAFEPSREGYKEVAKYRVSETPGLAYPIIAGNRVYVKGNDALTLWTLQ